MADLNFLNQIRDTEQKAAALLSEAADNARQLQDAARQQAADMIRAARDEAAVQLQTALAEAETKAGKILGEARGQTAVSAATRSVVSEQALEKAARSVAERIVSDNAHR